MKNEKFESAWDFVTQTLTANCYSDILSESDDYQKIVDGEINGNAELIYNNWLNDGLSDKQATNRAVNALNEVNSYLFEEAIKIHFKIS